MRNNFETSINTFSSVSSFYLTGIIEFSRHELHDYVILRVQEPSGFCILHVPISFSFVAWMWCKTFILHGSDFGFAVFYGTQENSWRSYVYLRFCIIAIQISVVSFVDLRVLLFVYNVAQPWSWKNIFWWARGTRAINWKRCRFQFTYLFNLAIHFGCYT